MISSRRFYFRIWCAGCFLIWCALAGGGQGASAQQESEAQPERYSVLLITMDTTRIDHLGAYSPKGSQTPNIDQLAAQGVTFETVRTQVPITLPSHSSIMTGMGVLEHGVHENATFTLSDRALTLAEAFQGEGYRTAAFVSAVVLDHKYGLAQGFETYDDEMTMKGPPKFLGEEVDYFERPAEETTTRALSWLEQSKIPEPDRPFFLWVHYFDPHARWAAPERYRKGRSRYAAEVAYMDEQIGVLLKGARAAEEKLVVVLTSDHGENFGGWRKLALHGRDIYDPVMRTALIFQGHERLQAGRRVAQPRSLRDVAATVTGLLGVDAVFPSSVNLLPAYGPEPPPMGPLYLETLLPALRFDGEEVRGLVEDDWKLVEWVDPKDPSVSRVELYRLDADSAENRDVSALYPQRVRSMRSAIARLVEQSKRSEAASDVQELDEETRKKLRALGYIGD